MLRLSTSPGPSGPSPSRLARRAPRAPRAIGRGRAARRLLALALLLVPLLAALACSGTTSTTVQPTTGVLIRAETLTTGRGCGRSATNLFKYVVVVYGYESGDPLLGSSYTRTITSNLFDCYTDGTFIELATSSEGNSRYRLEVYAYNEPAYVAASGAIGSAMAGAATNAAQLRSQTAPTWTTRCTAIQQRDVQALAQCDPLAPGLDGLGLGRTTPPPPTRITVGTTRFLLPDGRVATCRTAPPDAGADLVSDAGQEDADAAEDASAMDDADAPVDAGPPVLFTTARIRFRVGSAIVFPAVDVACPALQTVDVSTDPARYDIDVGLVDGTDVVGQTLCSATSQPGATSAAVCP